MNAKLLLTLSAGISILVASGSSVAEAELAQFDFVAPGGAIPDNGVGVFPLFMDPQVLDIQSIELEILGLTHESPWDLDIYLIHPRGPTIEIMTDRGDQVAIQGIDLTFADGAAGIPPEFAEILPGTYQPEGLFNATDLGFDTFIGLSGATDAWVLLMIDDDPNDSGSFEQYRLSGKAPEPATLSLLALGALAILRRRRRR